MRPFAALRRVLGRPRLVAALAGLNVVIALGAALPLWAALAPLFDMRPAAAQMLQLPDDGLFAELLSDHPELLPLLAFPGLAALIVHALASSVAAGGAWAALGPSEARGRAVWDAAARTAGPMLALGALGLLLRLVPLLLGAGAWLAIDHVTRGRGFAAASLGALATAAIVGASWSFVTVSADYARGVALGASSDGPTGARAPHQAMLDGLRTAVRRPGATARLCAFSAGGFLAVTAAYHALAWSVPIGPTAAFALVMALRLAAIWARAAVTTATFLAAAARA
jgi:hypothetical protein